MKKCLFSMLLMLFAGFVLSGCDWEAVSDDESWNDRFSWANFTGVYRGVGDPLVSNFSENSSFDKTSTNDTTTTTDDNNIVVTGESGGTAPATQTKLEGRLGHYPGIVPGSITIKFDGGSTGSFIDSGGTLNGTFNYVGPDSPEKTGTGTINYDTGEWTLDLESPGFLAPAAISISYVYDGGSASSTSTSSAEEDSGADNVTTSGGNVYSLSVLQTGDHLSITDSNGYIYNGKITSSSTTGGDTGGTTEGDIIASFTVNGNIGNTPVEIVGSFYGYYIPPDTAENAEAMYGVVRDRIIEATWIEPGLTADVRGATVSWVVTSNTITQAVN